MGNFVKMGFNDGGPIFPHSKKKLFCVYVRGNGGVGGAIKPSLSLFHVRIASGGEEDYCTTYTTLPTTTGECHNKNRQPPFVSRTINADILLFLCPTGVRSASKKRKALPNEKIFTDVYNIAISILESRQTLSRRCIVYQDGF